MVGDLAVGVGVIHRLDCLVPVLGGGEGPWRAGHEQAPVGGEPVLVEDGGERARRPAGGSVRLIGDDQSEAGTGDRTGVGEHVGGLVGAEHDPGFVEAEEPGDGVDVGGGRGVEHRQVTNGEVRVLAGPLVLGDPRVRADRQVPEPDSGVGGPLADGLQHEAQRRDQHHRQVRCEVLVGPQGGECLPGSAGHVDLQAGRPAVEAVADGLYGLHLMRAWIE